MTLLCAVKFSNVNGRVSSQQKAKDPCVIACPCLHVAHGRFLLLRNLALVMDIMCLDCYFTAECVLAFTVL